MLNSQNKHENKPEDIGFFLISVLPLLAVQQGRLLAWPSHELFNSLDLQSGRPGVQVPP